MLNRTARILGIALIATSIVACDAGTEPTSSSTEGSTEGARECGRVARAPGVRAAQRKCQWRIGCA